MGPIRFDRKPYTVTYMENGTLKTMRRLPAPKLHDALPGDNVEIKVKHSDDFDTGDTVAVKYINPHSPNVLQVEDSDGKTAFLPYFDVNITESGKIAERDGVPAQENPARTRYLLWP